MLTGLANLLYQAGYLDFSTLQQAVINAQDTALPITTYLVRNNLIESDTILTCCMKHFNLPVFDLRHYDFTLLKNSFLNIEMIYRYHVLPFKQHPNFIELGVADPTHQNIFSLISFHIGLPNKLILVSEELLDEIINKHYQPNLLRAQVQTTLSKLSLTHQNLIEINQTKEIDNEQDEPVIKFVDHLIEEAIEKNISDIHIEPQEKNCRIRFRKDGLLYVAAELPLTLAERIIMRLKIMANLDIAERRLPQDGHIEPHHLLKVDIRINTCPTWFGEKIVLRLLKIAAVSKDIDSIGLNKHQLALFIEKLIQPQGLILLTGPTGCGKTSTLYSALYYLNKIEKNIITIENPVEMTLPGINQININARIGLDFPTLLRSILRQDPDIIMIGEIRDKETALIATQAAQTGHLVLATLHANNALTTFSRLQALGVPFDQLIASVSLIIAQRLLRKLCPYCLTGCHQCHQGYAGRVGIFECLSITPLLANELLTHDLSMLETKLREAGQLFLWDAGLNKIAEGITNYAELRRVVGK